MFASIENIRARAAFRAADLIDLAIEFATLGEYGLEYPPESVSTGGPHAPSCPSDNRRVKPNSRPSPRRNPAHRQAPCRGRRPRAKRL